MRHLNLLLIFILINIVSMSCKKDIESESYDYLYTNEFVRDTVLIEISKGVIGNKHLFIINEKTLAENEINNIISKIKKEDIISVMIINKTEAVEKYTSIAKDGIVKINYYIDPLLKPFYYNIDNLYVLDIVNDLIVKNKVVRYPLIVLDGKPLRGFEIKEYLNNLNNDLIKSILLMDYKSGLQLYGERAINGVVIINTKS